MILFGDVEHGRKIATAAGCDYDLERHYVVSRIQGRYAKLLGGVIYTNFTGRSIQMHIAGFDPHWLSPEMIYTCFDFPFNVLKVERVISPIPSTNERSMNICQKFGFEYVTTIPGAVPGGDMEILSMSRFRCRWLKLGQRFSAGHMENAA